MSQLMFKFKMTKPSQYLVFILTYRVFVKFTFSYVLMV